MLGGLSFRHTPCLSPPASGAIATYISLFLGDIIAPNGVRVNDLLICGMSGTLRVLYSGSVFPLM